MNIFDKIIRTYDGFPGYKGDVPTNENEFNALELLGEWNDKPSWDEINSTIQASLYKEDRATAYPNIADQLDMLWHAIDEGTLDKTSTFYTSLKAVKDEYPKP